MTCRSRSGGLVHYMGGCYDCDASWSKRNVLGLAAIHHNKTGHATWAETGHTYSFGAAARESAHAAGLASRLAAPDR